MTSSPQIQALIRDNPEAASLFRDPQFLREQLRVATNPRLMQEQMRNNDRMLSNIESIPGGFNALSSVFRSMNSPADMADARDTSTELANRQFAERYGVNTSPTSTTGSPNDQALPNPWAAPPPIQRSPQRTHTTAVSQPYSPQMFMPNSQMFARPNTTATQQNSQPQASFNFASMMQALQSQNRQQSSNTAFAIPGFGMPQPSIPAPTILAPSQDSKQRYEKQIKELADMGFTDSDKCTRALLASSGDVSAAIDYLISLG